MDQTNSVSPSLSVCGSEMNGILPEMFKAILEQQNFNLQNQVGHNISNQQMDSETNPLMQSVIQYNAHMNLLNELKNNHVKQDFDASDINNTILGWQQNKQFNQQNDNIYQQLLSKLNLNNSSSKQDITIIANALSGMQNRSATDNENVTLNSVLCNAEQNSFSAAQILDQLALLGVTNPASVNGASFNENNNLNFNNQNNVPMSEHAKSSISPFSSSSQTSNNNSMYDMSGQFQMRRDHQRSNTASTKSKDTYCEYCQKYFCNRYFLKIHKLRRHKVNDDDTPIKKYSFDYNTCKKEGLSDTNIQEALAMELRAIAHENSKNHDGEMLPCDICSMTFEDMIGLISHKVKEHSFDPTSLIINASRNVESFRLASSPVFNNQNNNQNKESENKMNKSSDESAKIMEIIQKNNMRLQFNLPLSNTMTSPLTSLATLQNNQQIKNINQQNTLNNLTGSQTYECTTISRKQSSQTDSTAEAFCNLCNKKVCNKYFLRTHMFKMHKIVIDENKTTIGNVDIVNDDFNIGLKYRCDICMENVTTRQELIDHKMKTHNINDTRIRIPLSKNSSPFTINTDDNYNLPFGKSVISPDDIEMKINREVDDTLKKIKMEVDDKNGSNNYSQDFSLLQVKPYNSSCNNIQIKEESISPGQIKKCSGKIFKKKNKKIKKSSPFNLPKSYRLFTCVFCDKVFISKLICKIHMKKYHEEKVKEDAFNFSPSCSTANKENDSHVDSYDSVSKSVTPVHSLDLVLFEGITSIEEHNEGHRVTKQEEGNNSNTSGSTSPNSIHHDELYGKCVLDKPNAFLLQNFIVQYGKSANIGDPYKNILPEDLKLQLPVKFIPDSPFELNLKFCPIPQRNE
uniref:C2H2-type domain-containing protein n=1 Tax=Parastrongyloides trichosuri TaxID=131310 RepID=A0A0N5A464_PARTI